MTAKFLVTPFRRHHVAWLEMAGKAAGGSAPTMDDATLDFLEHSGTAWTAVVDGEPIGCGGTMQQWPGRHIAWAYLGQKTGPHMLAITRAVRKHLDTVKGRVELTVRCDFNAGHRWAEMLGFSIECPILERYGPEGEQHTSYVRFN
jgi:hypothetical protein